MAQVWTLVQDISALWGVSPDSTAGIYSVAGGTQPYAVAWGDTIPPPQGHTVFIPGLGSKPPYGISWKQTLQEAHDYAYQVVTG